MSFDPEAERERAGAARRARVEDDVVGPGGGQDPPAIGRGSPNCSRYGFRSQRQPGVADEVVLVAGEDDVRDGAAREHGDAEVRHGLP